MSWTRIEPEVPYIAVNYTHGRIEWNEATQRLLRYPSRVDILHDQPAGILGIVYGYRFVVVHDEDGAHRANVEQSDLTAAGISSSFQGTATAVEWIPGEPEPVDGLVIVPYLE